jgi:4'-phosphopantetheinyl transferase EntD
VDFGISFVRSLPYGLCVGVTIPPDDLEIAPTVMARLHPDEARHAATLHPRRRSTWVAGRLALRAALTEIGATSGPILVNDRGAPALPPGVVGSISHKRLLAVGLAARASGWTVGIDVEQRHLGKQDISRHVLTAAEQAELAELDPLAREQAIMLRFSLKESIYKAIDPHVRRFVGFQEVSVSILPDGDARVDPHLEGGARLHVEGWWTLGTDHVLTVARARPSPVLDET